MGSCCSRDHLMSKTAPIGFIGLHRISEASSAEQSAKLSSLKASFDRSRHLPATHEATEQEAAQADKLAGCLCWRPARTKSDLASESSKGDLPPSSPMAEERYQFVQELGAGTFGIANLVRDTVTGEEVAVKYLPRGPEINAYTEREILNHRILRHPHVVTFREAFLTPSHLAIAMDYAAGGELFQYLVSQRRFTENKARYFFQQLIVGLGYCHSQGVCHRDLKLENILLHGHPPLLKICDFGYSKNAGTDTCPKSVVGTKAYIAPEVIMVKYQENQYDGKAADVWSCGVILFLMLVGRYPFDDPAGIAATFERIMKAQYDIPADVVLSPECQDMLRRLLTVRPRHRITIAAIREHPFFRRNLPRELINTMQDGGTAAMQGAAERSAQSLSDLRNVLSQARQTGPSA